MIARVTCACCAKSACPAIVGIARRVPTASHLPRIHALARMSLFGNTGAGAFGRPAQAAPVEQDIEVAQPPPDGISAMSFHPSADFLAVSCWDNNVGAALG